MKNTQGFLERFNRWKNGAPIQELYNAGRPVTFDEGKDQEGGKENDPALRAALEYAISLKLDEFDEGKDKPMIDYIKEDSPLSYGKYYDVTGDPAIDAMLPRFTRGKNKKTAFTESIGGKNRQLVDDTIDYFLSAGIDPMLISGIVGNIAQESRFDPNAVGPGGFKGTVQMSEDMAKEINRVYGKVDAYTTNQFIHEAMSQDKKISREWRKYMRQHGGYYGNTYVSPEEAAMSFGRVFERPSERHANWNQRKASAAEAYDYILNRQRKQSGGNNYDMKRAVDLGYRRDSKGHMPSRDYKTGRILKGSAHETFSNAVYGDMADGYDLIAKPDGFYTLPNYTRQQLPNLIQMWNNINDNKLPTLQMPK